MLAAICAALETPLSQVFREVSDNFALAELQQDAGLVGPREPGLRLGEPSLRLAASRVPVPAEGGKAASDLADVDAMDVSQIDVATVGKEFTGHAGGIRDVTDMVPV